MSICLKLTNAITIIKSHCEISKCLAQCVEWLEFDLNSY